MTWSWKAPLLAAGLALQGAGLPAQATGGDAATIARALFVAIDAGDFARTGALLDDSLRLHYQGVPDPIAKSTLLELLRGYAVSFPDMRHEVLEVLPSGQHVTVRLVLHATHRGPHEGVAATGRTVAVAGIHILRFARGKVIEWWAAEDDLGLLRQIGMVIAPPKP
jgi:predicted ester cyclase